MYYSDPHKSIIAIEQPIPRWRTGLLDQNGNAIFRYETKQPLGFVHFKEPDEEQEETLNGRIFD